MLKPIMTQQYKLKRLMWRRGRHQVADGKTEDWEVARLAGRGLERVMRGSRGRAGQAAMVSNNKVIRATGGKICVQTKTPRRLLKKMAVVMLAVMTLAATVPQGLATAVSATMTGAAASCPDLQAVFARGSGESLNGDNYSAYREALTETFSEYAPSLNLGFYELGSEAQGGAQYPAVSVENLTTLTGAAVSMGKNFAFGKSVEQGMAELKNYVTARAEACPGMKFILGGYSQGAMVISKSLPNLDPEKIVYAATFGDPKLYLPEGKVTFAGATPEACRGKNLSAYRINVPDCTVSAGILTGLNPYQAAGYAGKLGTWCHQGDPMCGSFPSMSSVTENGLLASHISYPSDSTYPEAAKVILSAAKTYFTSQISTAAPVTSTTSTARDTAILIDSTGSMRSLIDTYKKEALKIAKSTIDQGGRIALYEYRDEVEEDFAPRQLCDFTCTYEEFFEKLSGITTDAGGKDPESALSGLLHVMNELSWQQGATKSIILITDASYHSTDVGGITLSDVVQRSREIDPVNVYVITTDAIASAYADLTTQTGGKVFRNATEYAKSTEYVLTRPVAHLLLDHYYAYPGEEIFFDASESVSTYAIDHYEWDLDFDGVFDARNTTFPDITFAYDAPTEGLMQVKVVDANGQFSTMTAMVTILDPAVARPEITDYDLTVGEGGATLTLTAVDTELFMLSLDDAPLGLTADTTVNLTEVPDEFSLQVTPLTAEGVVGETVTIRYFNTESASAGAEVVAMPRVIDSGVMTAPATDSFAIESLLNTPRTDFFRLKAPATGVGGIDANS